jgi:hypothetical protein
LFCSQNGNHPYKDVEKVVNHHEEDLAKYGYKPVMKYTRLSASFYIFGYTLKTKIEI